MTTVQPSRGELAAMLAAARGCTRSQHIGRSLGSAQLAVVAFGVVVLVSASNLAGIHHGSPVGPFLSGTRASVVSVPRALEDSQMRLVRSVVVGSALSVGSFASAQTAVQWRIEDGGNGHWYAVTGESLIYPQLRLACEVRGGHLATLTTQAEWEWVKTHLPISGLFVGGYQDHASPAYAEPNGGWRWVTGEPFVIDTAYMGTTHIFCTMTVPGFDDCPAGTCGLCGCGTPGAQDALMFTGCCGNVLEDVGDGVTQNCDSWARHGIIEWSADCNGDGVVDYGQIRSGALADSNLNSIPDCCEEPLRCDPCRADTDQSGAVNGVDLAAILNNWGNSGGKQPRSDVNQDGLVDGADLAEVLNSWGACP